MPIEDKVTQAIETEERNQAEEQSQEHSQPISSTPPGISRTMLNFWIDAILLTSALSMTWVTVMLMVVFPIPTRSEGMILLGMDYNQWRQVQFGLLMLSALLALEHLVLHWKWVCGVIVTKILKLRKRPDEAIQAVYGVGFFIGTMLFMGFLIVLAKLIVKLPPQS